MLDKETSGNVGKKNAEIKKAMDREGNNRVTKLQEKDRAMKTR